MHRHPHRPAAPRWTRVAIVAIALAAGSSSATATIYHCRDEAGRLEFRDRPCAEDSELLKRTSDDGRRSAVTPPPRPTASTERAVATETEELEREFPALVGLWHEAATGENLTVMPDGTFSVVSPTSYLFGDWIATAGERFTMTASAGGRTLACAARAEPDTLEVDCEGDVSEYRRR